MRARIKGNLYYVNKLSYDAKLSRFFYTRAMSSDLGTRLSQRRRALGLSQAEVGRYCGVSQSAIQQIEDGKTRRPRYIHELAEILQTTREWLVNGGDAVEIESKKDKKLGIDNRRATEQNSDLNDIAHPDHLIGEARIADVTPVGMGESRSKIKVFGLGQGGSSGDFLTIGRDAVTFVDRPATLTNAPNVFGFYMVGDTMSPAIDNGDLRFVDPARPPSAGDYVLIREIDESGENAVAHVKRLVRRTGSEIVAEQISPPQEVKFSAAKVVVQRIIPWNEIHGA